VEQKKKRLESEKKGEKSGAKPFLLKYGIQHVTHLVEKGKAKLVVLAHDVDPIELVLWLPALCRSMGVPYVIVKSKSRLGLLTHKKTCTALAITEVRKEDLHELELIVKNAKQLFNENPDVSKWGGGVMGAKSQRNQEEKERLVAQEAAKKAGL
jgi:large subunit ribosomal protein L7Ae